MAGPLTTTSVADGPATVGRGALAAGAAATVVGAFLFRFLTVEFTDDHFVHLSRAWQILQGDVPVRDFFDPGLILQYYASAAVLFWSGHNLFGEAILTIGFIAAGAGLTLVAAARLSGSLWIGLGATFIAILSTPRLYGYPKVFFYALAIAGAWRYAHRPGNGSLAALAIITAVAFLFRHDHGAYIAVATVPLMAILHWGRPRELAAAFTRYAAVTVALLLPYLVFVHVHEGILRHVRSISPQARRVSSFQVNALRFTIDRSAPLLALSPAADRRVNVRWSADLDADERERLEGRHGLTRPAHVEGSTWSYVLADEGPERVGALVADPAVADTHGIDRARLEVAIDEPLYIRVQRWVPILRTQLAPGVFSRENALAWFYYVTLLLPFVSLALLAWLLGHGAIGSAEASVAGMATVLCLVVVQTLVRGSPDSRLADVVNPICVVGAWVARRALRPGVWTGAPLPFARTAVVSAVAIVTLWSVAADARALDNLGASRILTGPAGVWWRMGVVSERLRTRPIDTWAAEDRGIPDLARYVLECTEKTDRLLVTWFAPHVFFYAERPFAGGQVYLTANWHASPADQWLTVERLRHQRVPVVLERADGDYDVRFPVVFDYVHRHYRNAPMASEGMKQFRVLVDRRLRPAGVYKPLGLPCYR